MSDDDILIGYGYTDANGRYAFDAEMWVDDLEAAMNAPVRRIPFMPRPPFVINAREDPERIFSLLSRPRQGCPILFSAPPGQISGAGFVCMADALQLALVFEIELFDYHPAFEEMICAHRIRSADVRKVAGNIEGFLSESWPAGTNLDTPEPIFCIRDGRDKPLGFFLGPESFNLAFIDTENQGIELWDSVRSICDDTASDELGSLPVFKSWFEPDAGYSSDGHGDPAQLQEASELAAEQEDIGTDERRRLLRLSFKNLEVNAANGLPHGKHLIRRLLIRHPELWQRQ